MLALDAANRIEATGNYALFTQAFNIAYRVHLEKLENLESLTKQKLFGSLNTEGSVIGDMERITVAGTSDLAHSQTRYKVALEQFQPQHVTLDIKGARTEALLSMLGRAPYALAAFRITSYNVCYTKLLRKTAYVTGNHTGHHPYPQHPDGAA